MEPSSSIPTPPGSEQSEKDCWLPATVPQQLLAAVMVMEEEVGCCSVSEKGVGELTEVAEWAAHQSAAARRERDAGHLLSRHCSPPICFAKQLLQFTCGGMHFGGKWAGAQRHLLPFLRSP